MFEIGQVIEQENYTQAALWCNKNGAHIKQIGAEYVIEANAAAAAPTAQERVQAQEVRTGLTRAVRELVLAENSGASEYVKSKAQEIETLAAPLREESNE